MTIQNGDLYVLQQGETKYNVTYEQLRSAILSGTSTPLIQPDVPSADVSNVGQFWWDSDIGQLYIYYQDPSGDKYWVNASTPGLPNAAQVTVSTTPPLSPQPGNLWWKDDAGVLYVYYLDPTGDQYWVDTNPAGNPLEDATLQLVTDNGNFTTQSVNIGNTDTAPNIQLKSDGSSQFNDDLVVFDVFVIVSADVGKYCRSLLKGTQGP